MQRIWRYHQQPEFDPDGLYEDWEYQLRRLWSPMASPKTTKPLTKSRQQWKGENSEFRIMSKQSLSDRPKEVSSNAAWNIKPKLFELITQTTNGNSQLLSNQKALTPLCSKALSQGLSKLRCILCVFNSQAQPPWNRLISQVTQQLEIWIFCNILIA